MSTDFKPLTIPPGVVTTPTKKVRSSNWAETNLVRWVQDKLAPIGPQAPLNYVFASRCKLIHGWYGLDAVYRIAYLCEQHLYVDENGALTDITPTGGLPVLHPLRVGGYGDGAYSDGTYGTPRPLVEDIAVDRIPAAFSLDNFGAILLAMTSVDGRLLMWDPAVGGLAAAVTPATGSIVPHGRCFVVTPERFVMMFGTFADGTDSVGPPPIGGSARRFAWCEQEDFTDWSYADVVSQSGFLDVEPASPILTAISTKTGVVFWTAKKAYRSRFLGLPYVYDYEELADDCAPWSPQSMATTSSMLLWMAEQGVFSYDGASILPVKCMVKPWIDADIDKVNVRQEACAVHVASFSEFWWFFPQAGEPWNTRVVIYSYKEGWWSQGVMARSAGITSSYTAHTIMADGTIPIQHEVLGSRQYVNADLPWAETFNLNLGMGARLTTLKQMIPDIDIVDVKDGDYDRIGFSLYARMSRSRGDVEQLFGPKTIRDNGYVDFRTTARDIRLRIAVMTSPVPNFTIGEAQWTLSYGATDDECDEYEDRRLPALRQDVHPERHSPEILLGGVQQGEIHDRGAAAGQEGAAEWLTELRSSAGRRCATWRVNWWRTARRGRLGRVFSRWQACDVGHGWLVCRSPGG